MPAAVAFMVNGASGAVRQSTAFPGGTGLSAARNSGESGVFASMTFTPIWKGSVQPAASYGVSSPMSGYTCTSNTSWTSEANSWFIGITHVPLGYVVPLYETS
jgi:hypothetical protein